jgi:hypothetical protein
MQQSVVINQYITNMVDATAAAYQALNIIQRGY